MSDRQDFLHIRTDRPTRDDALLTVADVLAEPVLQAGAPEVIVGGRALDAAVRWVHVSDSAGVARLLDGGELLLSTGAIASWQPLEAFRDDDAELLPDGLLEVIDRA